MIGYMAQRIYEVLPADCSSVTLDQLCAVLCYNRLSIRKALFRMHHHNGVIGVWRGPGRNNFLYCRLPQTRPPEDGRGVSAHRGKRAQPTQEKAA